MTRKHIKAIADILKSSEDRIDAINKLSIYFSLINSKFDNNKFKRACGIDC